VPQGPEQDHHLRLDPIEPRRHRPRARLARLVAIPGVVSRSPGR
jgi:hypothetical protein